MKLKQLFSARQLDEENPSFWVTDISHEPNYVMVLVKGPSWEEEHYYGVNVLFKRGGKIDFGTYDRYADKELGRYRDKIVEIAKHELLQDKESIEFLKELGHL